MNIWTLEVIKIHHIEADPNTKEERFTEEKLLAGVFGSKEAAMACWSADFKKEWDDYDLTEWQI